MFCAVSENYQHIFEKWYMHLIVNLSIKKKKKKKFSKNLKNSIKIKIGQAVLELLIQNQHFDCFDL